MPHDFNPQLEAIITSGWWIDQVAVEIDLQGGSTLRYATIDIEIDSDVYISRLKKIADMSETLQGVPDRVSLELYNADGEAGLLILNPEDVLDGAVARVYRIIINVQDPDDKHRVEWFYGLVDSVKSDEQILTVQVVSDIDAHSSLVGDLKVVKICQAISYKDPITCGYVGDIPTCDRTLDGINGCRVHFPNDEALSHFSGHAVFLDESTIESLKNNGVVVTPPPPLNPVTIPERKLPILYGYSGMIVYRDA
jgi:hypothetical protein